MWVTRDHIVDVVKRERDQQKMSPHVSAIFYQAQITERKSARENSLRFCVQHLSGNSVLGALRKLRVLGLAEHLEVTSFIQRREEACVHVWCVCACVHACTCTHANKSVNYTAIVSEAGESWVPEEPELYSGTKESDVSSPSDCLHLPPLGWFLETAGAHFSGCIVREF